MRNWILKWVHNTHVKGCSLWSSLILFGFGDISEVSTFLDKIENIYKFVILMWDYPLVYLETCLFAFESKLDREMVGLKSLVSYIITFVALNPYHLLEASIHSINALSISYEFHNALAQRNFQSSQSSFGFHKKITIPNG